MRRQFVRHPRRYAGGRSVGLRNNDQLNTDALLGFLQSESRMENANNEAQDDGHGLAAPGMVEALLFEIAAALASGEVGDDQDHG